MSFAKWLTTITVLELFLGGTGQVIKIAGLPLRQILFVIVLGHFLWIRILLGRSMSLTKQGLFVVLMLVWLIISALIGLLNGHKSDIIFNDVTPLLYFLMYFPLEFYLKRGYFTIEYIRNLLMLSSFVVSLICIILYFVLHWSFSSDTFLFYDTISATIGREVFWFRRGGYVFYPGLFFVCIATIIVFSEWRDKRYQTVSKKIVYYLGIVALILSMTKGFILVLILSHILIIIKSIQSAREFFKNVFFAILLFLITVNIFEIGETRLLQFRGDEGMNIRYSTLSESLDKILYSPVIGNGFGTELPSKLFHQENSFLDILVEQGLIGLFFYTALLSYFFVRKEYLYTQYVLLLMSYVLSMTNPYINNPIGIGLLVLLMLESLVIVKSQ